MVIQFVTGHGFLMKHRSMLDLDVSAECRLCLEEDEDSEHLWWECPDIETGQRKIPIEKKPSNWYQREVHRFLQMPPLPRTWERLMNGAMADLTPTIVEEQWVNPDLLNGTNLKQEEEEE